MDFSVVTGKTVHNIIHENLAECVQIVRDAYLAHHRGESVNPNSYFLRFPDKPDARIIALPASLSAGFEVSGIKWIASYPANIKKNIPRASAVLILNRLDTGYPFACLEASVISAARTAASAVTALEALNGGKRQGKSIGIVGTGFIARYIYNFLMKLGWELPELHLFDANAADAERFGTQVVDRSRHQSISVSPSAAALMRSCDMVAFATSAGAPYIDDLSLFEHNPIVLNISLRDVSARVILASQNVVDDVGHVMNANTSVHLAEQATGGRAFVNGTLAQLLNEEITVDRSRPIIFSPFGLGILDLAVGKWVHDQAVKTGASLAIDDFFFDMTR